MMKKKKRAFALIEVLIAIVLASTAAYFLLNFESSLVSQHKKSLSRLQQEQLLQEATAKFYEALYTNQIPWNTMKDQRSIGLELSAPSWRAEYQFIEKEQKKEINPNHLYAKVIIELFQNDKKIEKNSTSFDIFCKKEDRSSVDSPQK